MITAPALAWCTFLNCGPVELPCLDLDDALDCVDILDCCLEDRNDGTSDILLEGLGVLNGDGVLE